MNYIMGSLLAVLAILKLIDIKGFAERFAQYDLLAAKSRPYAIAYPFIELLLGLGLIAQWQTWWMGLISLIIFGIGAIGVARALVRKQKLQCACVGAKFNLPLTAFTLGEDILMVLMGGWVVLH